MSARAPDRAHSVAPVSDDLISQEAIRAQVEARYRGVIGQATDVASFLYEPDALAWLPRARARRRSA